MGLRSWLLEGEKTMSVKETMAGQYKELTKWLAQFNLLSVEIKETLPELYQDIQDCIQRLDNTFINEDMPAFQNALERIRLLYTEALFKCGRHVAVKVWSEILQAYLWVVETDQDMHSLRSQGVTEAIYTGDEIKNLKGLNKDSLNQIHKVKKTFESSKVEEVKWKGSDSQKYSP